MSTIFRHEKSTPNFHRYRAREGDVFGVVYVPKVDGQEPVPTITVEAST